MTMSDAIYKCKSTHNFPEEGVVTWESPSNIALVKYWGKKAVQIPTNPSISLTLNNCSTTTKLSFKRSEKPNINLTVSGIKNTSFLNKIHAFIERIESYCPYVKNYSFDIETSNTFPHSSGIASSASGFSALALCIVSIEKELLNLSEEFFFQKSSFISRLGSGSACRSIYGPLAVWGKHSSYENSNDEHAIPFNHAHELFQNYQDTILLVDKGKKQVSSSVGHQLMNNHPFAESRFNQAHFNIDKIKNILISGDLDAFNELVELEALSLHAMMMTSNPYFMLFKANTINIINKVWDKRNSSSLPMCITLDAGANVHLLYPEKYKNEILGFIREELIGYCENQQYICDKVGNGPFIKKEHYA